MGTENRSNHKTDIVIVGWNHLDLTERCFDRIKRNTAKESYHIIYVDNGSNRIPEELLQTYVSAVLLPTNTGYCHGNNVGLALSLLSDSEFVLLLNNDTWIPEGDTTWLERMIAPMSDSKVGAVGAVSDRVFGYQRRPLNFVGEHTVFVPTLIGFCLLLRKEAIGGRGNRVTTDTLPVGLLDERFDLDGNFSDYDYSIRLQRAGWKLAIAESVFIHHEMSVTQRDLDFQANLDKNKRKLFEKWDREALKLVGL